VTDEQIIEAMARARWAAQMPTPPQSWDDLSECDRSDLLLEERAAFAIAKYALIERCAVTVEKLKDSADSNGLRSTVRYCAFKEAASALRQLKETQG
jgi:hypothetical protein